MILIVDIYKRKFVFYLTGIDWKCAVENEN